MVQHWDLVNFDALSRINGGKLGEFFCRRGLLIDISHFTIPSWSEKSTALLCHRHPRVAHISSSPASGLLRLPKEVLKLIFECVDGLADAVCLCLGDGRLFPLGFSRVMYLQKLVYADWAGDQVVCLGDCTRDDDYPGALQELISKRSEEWPISNPATFQFGLSFLITNSFISLTDSTVRPAEYHCKRSNLGDDPAAFEMLVIPRYESHYPWVLCNLSSKEYVRADVIAALGTDDIGGGTSPFIKGPINLGHALLSRICWSSDAYIAMNYEGSLHRGSWAGGRFEVTTSDKLPAGEWQDVSGEVSEVLEKIWKSEHGDSWRETTRGT